MMKKSGIKGVLYRFFRNKETSLYKSSDYIGCMSPANVKYIVDHNHYLNPDTVEVAPNSIELSPIEKVDAQAIVEIKKKYGLPIDKPIFIYGGNLGKPQGIDFLVQCLEANKNRDNCHFVVVGSGTERGKLEEWYKAERPQAVSLLNALPKADYDALVRTCDVGLIFLDHRFTIPNYPSRLLSYMEYKMPVIACTDRNCDMGSMAEDNGYGLFCESNDVHAFTKAVDNMLAADRKGMGQKGYQFLCANYQVENTYRAIINHCE